MNHPQPPANAFQLPLQVGESDVDRQGHVSNVRVVGWFSRAAFAHSEALGYDLDAYRRLGGWFVVRRHEIDYHQPARAGDELLLHTWPTTMARATAERRYLLLRVADSAPVARGLTVWAYVNVKTGRPMRIPDELRRAFRTAASPGDG